MSATDTSGEIDHAAEQAQREEFVTQAVIDSWADTPSPRLREVLDSLVRHVHSFVRDVRLTEPEWEAAIAFLTACGDITTDKRQEFILLSDVLGVSMLTVAVNQPPDARATEATVFGPFFVDDAPRVEIGGDIAQDTPGQPCWVEGSVRGVDGEPIPGARIEVWEADEDGFYDVQYNDDRTAGRAHLFSDDSGDYSFWGVTPTPYPIPDDGPVGELLTATGRSPMRPAHLHFMVTAPGYHRLVTHIFVRGDGSPLQDAVFGVKDSLTLDFVDHEAGENTPNGRVVEAPWTSTRFDIVLTPDSTSGNPTQPTQPTQSTQKTEERS